MENLEAIFHYSSSSTPPSSADVSSQLSLNHYSGHADDDHPNYDPYKTNHQYMSSQQHEDDHELPRLINGNTCSSDDQLASSSVVKKGEKKIRKPKYAFQTRSQVDILDDGYRWRKYGQKAVKNNKFPRSYYRCTQEGCNVKKQIQRLSKDEGVVVTTYEGMHTHPILKSTDNFDHILNQMQLN